MSGLNQFKKCIIVQVAGESQISSNIFYLPFHHLCFVNLPFNALDRLISCNQLLYFYFAQNDTNDSIPLTAHLSRRSSIIEFDDIILLLLENWIIYHMLLKIYLKFESHKNKSNQLGFLD